MVYRIFKSLSYTGLEDIVNNLLKEEWTLVGSLCVVYSIAEGKVFYQAMTKQKEKLKDDRT